MTPESRIEVLDAAVPVALFPVRLETRFMADVTELRIRIYPDALHIDNHEPGLTATELEAGQRYWTERWSAPTDTEVSTAIWNEVARAFGPQRALWVVHATRPSNHEAIGGPVPPSFPTPDSRDAEWTRAAMAALLPDHWVAIGIRGGVEIFRKAGAPIPPDLPLGPDPAGIEEETAAGTVPLMDEGLRWVADYERAVELGMAISVFDAEVAGNLSEGLDQLLVVGVHTGTEPEENAKTVATALLSHLYGDGLAFVPPGSPTNNTEALRTGEPDPVEALTQQLDPAISREVGPGSGARLLEDAFGLDPDSALLALAPHAASSDRRTTSLLVDVLWFSTLGLYLDQLLDPFVDDDTVDRVRVFARRYLHPGGPLPVLRIGKQPYGILPIVAGRRFRQSVEGDVTDGDVEVMLRLLRPFWEAAVVNVPRLGKTDDRDTELLQLLQMVPHSLAARFRRVFGPELEPNTEGLQTHAMAQQYYSALIGQLAMGWTGPPRIASFTSHPRAFHLRVPWVQAGEPGEGPLTPNYLKRIAKTLREDGGRSALDEREGAGTLLEALVSHAALNEYDRAAARAVIAHQVRIGAMQAEPSKVALRFPETVRIEGPAPPSARPGLPGPVQLDTPRELSDVILPEVTGDASVGQWLAEQIRNPTPNPPPPVEVLLEFLTSLDALSDRPAAELDRALRGILDSCSHRIDAWYTALATARLQAMRRKRPRGIQFGGYGWVEELRPEGTPDSLGYLHAPSLEQANAAAILRSGHLAHRDAEHQALNIDLRSDRVRLALELLQGVAQGQPLAALLGYRIERGLRDRDPRLARFIAPLRRRFPLKASELGPAVQPSEEVAIRDVVDGVALLERWRNERTRMLAGSSIPATEWDGVGVVLDGAEDALDAVSDLLVTESVFQTAAGNPERARAALAVLDRQERPVEPQVVRTPRDGYTYVQRLLVLVGDETLPAGWRQQTDPRGAAEPRLNAWIARSLGNPARFRFSGRIHTANEAPREVEITLRDLDLSPMSLLMASGKAGSEAPSELEERIALRMSAFVQPDDVDPRLEIDGGAPTSEQVGLEALLVLLEWMRKLTAHRPADARDLALSEDDVEPGVDVAELAGRADLAEAAFDRALNALDTAARARKPTEKRLRTVLSAAAAVGAQQAVPQPIIPSSAGTEASAAVVAALQAQGRDVLERMRRTRAELDRLSETLGGAGAPASERELTRHHTARIRALFGEDFPVLPRFSAANPDEVAASFVEQEALCGGDRLAPSSWLQRMALVRPEVDSLQQVLTAAELLGGPLSHADLRVLQLPHLPGQRWLALPLAAGSAPRGDVAIVAHASGVADLSAPLAGLACDDWAETIPAAEQVTGLSFHYDAPGARAPNAILLAVPADPESTGWTVDDLIEVVREASDLAKMRLVSLRQLALGIALPAIYLPENFQHDVPSVRVSALTQRADSGPGVLGRTV